MACSTLVPDLVSSRQDALIAACALRATLTACRLDHVEDRGHRGLEQCAVDGHDEGPAGLGPPAATRTGGGPVGAASTETRALRPSSA